MSDAWSRRKQAVAETEAAARRAKEVARDAEEQAGLEAAQAEMTEAELLTSLNLPDPDQAKSGDDIAAFLAREVPQHIRNRALRSLWRSNPVLACVDGLNDYDGDFTGNGLNGGVLKTSYQVGKGLTAHVEKMAREAEARRATPPDIQASDKPDENNREIHNIAESENFLDADAPPVEDLPVDTVPEEGTHPVVEPVRRIRFTFEEEDRE